ncbi:MAG: energy-coupling factor ABC transporter ATP-binding protein [Methanosarcinales archaeon]|nr:energy-coupling factor ABC transporter ATP-binding protein [Methanosarcinales archaeon]
MFSLKNVRFKDIIRYPDIQIQQNRITFICGESGYGKSTLLKLLSGAVSPDAGEVFYNDKPNADYDPILLRREVLLCGQSAFLFDSSIRKNFEQYYSYRDLPAISPEQMQMYLKICAIDISLDTPCTTMSGGERHRVFIAICLSLRPKVLLLDEPTSALDDMTANTVLTNIRLFCREHKITLIIVSHNTALVQSYADDTITLSNNTCEKGTA